MELPIEYVGFSDSSMDKVRARFFMLLCKILVDLVEKLHTVFIYFKCRWSEYIGVTPPWFYM